MPGLRITEWGPAGWNILHAMAHTLPETLDARERTRLRRFLDDFAYFLPCRVCSRHFAEFLRVRATDHVLSTRDGVVRLLFDAHNDVNVRNGKPRMRMEEYRRVYSLDPDRGVASSMLTLSLSVSAAMCLYAVGVHYTRTEKKLVPQQ